MFLSKYTRFADFLELTIHRAQLGNLGKALKLKGIGVRETGAAGGGLKLRRLCPTS